MSFSEVSLSSTDDPEGSQMALRRAESRRFFLEALRRLRFETVSPFHREFGLNLPRARVDTLNWLIAHLSRFSLMARRVPDRLQKSQSRPFITRLPV